MIKVTFGPITITRSPATIYVPVVIVRTGTWPIGEPWFRGYGR